MNYSLPTEVEIGGNVYPIRSDYRAILDIFEVFGDPDLDNDRNALAALAEHLGIRKEEIACIGDGENDLSMFRVSGLKIAMGNGVPELKEQADHVTGTNRHKGAAEAIKKYILS